LADYRLNWLAGTVVPKIHSQPNKPCSMIYRTPSNAATDLVVTLKDFKVDTAFGSMLHAFTRKRPSLIIVFNI
jgi:hypothetical protein